MRNAATRAAAKARIRAAIDPVINDAFGGARLANGALPYARFSTVPAFAAKVTREQLVRLAADPRVVAISYNMPMTTQLDLTLPLIGAKAAYKQKAQGQKRAVAVIDTGVQRDHPFIRTDRVVAEACILPVGRNQCPNGTNNEIGPGTGEAKGTQSHGTHVAGIAMGYQASGTPRRGVAFKSKLVIVDIFGADAGTTFDAIQRAFEHIEDLVINNPTLRIAAINMSVGGGSHPTNCDADSTMALLKPVVDSLRSKLVLSAVAAGNNGFRNAMSFPACLSSIVSVAATSRTGVVSSYTNISATTDLFAPGGETGGDCVLSYVPTSTFAQFCGTSMAAPHVAGALSVLRSKVPTATAAQLEEALKFGGIATGDTRFAGPHAAPRLRLDRALNRLLNPAPPANDAFAGAPLLTHDGTKVIFGSNLLGTKEIGEPNHGVATSGQSIWWRWRPTTSGPVTISTLGTGFDTVLAVYTGGTFASLVQVAQNDDAAVGEPTSSVTFNATGGVTYRIAVAGKTSTQQGHVQLNFARPVANDNFANAIAVSVPGSGTVSVTGTNVGATKETGEPNHDGLVHATTSVWYRFTAPNSGTIQINTCDAASFDTVLAVYTGTAVNALTPIVSNDDTCGLRSQVSFTMVAGTVYRVAVAGYGGASGTFALKFTTPAP